MTEACFDSNIVIDVINGVPAARAALVGTDRRVASIVTWIEVLAGCRNADEEVIARTLLAAFEIVPLDPEVAGVAMELRRTRRLKLPDAVILATARISGLPLTTRNTKDFSETNPEIRVPYRL